MDPVWLGAATAAVSAIISGGALTFSLWRWWLSRLESLRRETQAELRELDERRRQDTVALHQRIKEVDEASVGKSELHREVGRIETAIGEVLKEVRDLNSRLFTVAQARSITGKSLSPHD